MCIDFRDDEELKAILYNAMCTNLPNNIFVFVCFGVGVGVEVEVGVSYHMMRRT